MKKINLRELYPDAYTTDFFVNVTEDVLETIRASERAEAAYERKMYRYKAQYSLDCENGIENTVLTKPQTPEMVLEEKQLQKQVYVEFIAQEWPDTAQLQDTFAAIHDRKFVPAHKLFTTMSSDEFKMGKKIPLLIMRRGIKCDIQKLDSQLLNNIA